MKRRLLTLPMLALILTGCHTLDTSGDLTSPTSWENVPILWEKPATENGLTVIIGSLRAHFGQFRFSWKIELSGKASVVTAEPSGTAEKPFYGNMELYLWFFERDKVLIMRHQKPTLGSDKPALLVPISLVGAKDLIGALGATSVWPSAISEPVTVTPWESAGIYWKTVGSGLRVTHTTDRSGLESILYPLQIGKEGSSLVILFKATHQKTDKNEIEFLTPVAKVSAKEFFAAYAKASGR